MSDPIIELTDLIRESITDKDGSGSDLESAEPFGKQWIEVHGNLDIQDLASWLIHKGYRKTPEEPEGGMMCRECYHCQ